MFVRSIDDDPAGVPFWYGDVMGAAVDFFDFEGGDVGDFDCVASHEVLHCLGAVELGEHVLGGMVTLSHKFDIGAVGHVFEFALCFAVFVVGESRVDVFGGEFWDFCDGDDLFDVAGCDVLSIVLAALAAEALLVGIERELGEGARLAIEDSWAEVQLIEQNLQPQGLGALGAELCVCGGEAENEGEDCEQTARHGVAVVEKIVLKRAAGMIEREEVGGRFDDLDSHLAVFLHIFIKKY